MKVGMQTQVTRELLERAGVSYIKSTVKENLIKGLSQFLVEELKDEIINREVNHGISMNFSLSLHVYTKKQHIKIVKALDEAYGGAFTSELLKGK